MEYRQDDKETLTLFVTGEIDHHHCAELREQADMLINKFSPKKVTLSFKGVTFCDSSAIAFVMGRYRLMQSLGGTLKICDADNRAEKIFLLATVDKYVEITKKEGK